MPYEIYKLIHLTGIVMLFSGLTALIIMKITSVSIIGPAKTFAFVTHGIGLFLILLGGFGLLARLGLAREIPTWAIIKLGIWILFGAAIAFVKRRGQAGWPVYLSLLTLFVTAAYLAIAKPI